MPSSSSSASSDDSEKVEPYVGSRYIPDVDRISVHPEHQTIERGTWGSAIEFFITSIGFAVGLGNVWRFPFKVYKNGGAVFLIPYALALVFLAIPLQMLEASIGQYSKKGPVGVWDTVPLLRGIGIATFYSTTINNIYYNTPISWACYYFIRSCAAVLPWSTCDDSWPHPCVTPDHPLLNETTNTTSPTMFFYQDVLQITDDILNIGNFAWPLFLCNLFLWLLLFAGTSFGAKTLGKVAYFTSLFPYVMLTVMIGYTATLPGSLIGIEYYLVNVDWSRLSDITVWRDAVAQVFYSTNCGFGASIQLASYNRYRHNILRDATIIPLLDGVTSIFAGFSVFTVLGYMASSRGVEVKDVATDGPGLIFITYAEAFSSIEGGNIWAIFFFFMVILLGISSQLPCVEMCCSVISDSFPWFNGSRFRNLMMRLSFAMFSFAIATIFYFGAGYYWYALIDEVVAGVPLMIIGLAELIGIGWIYSKPFCSYSGHKLLDDIGRMIGEIHYTKWFWIITWTFVAPISIAGILLFDIINSSGLDISDYPWTVTLAGPPNNGSYIYDDWAVGVGWGLVGVCPFIMFVAAFWVACYEYNGYKAVYLAVQPSKWVGADSKVPSQVASQAASQMTSRRNTNTIAVRPYHVVHLVEAQHPDIAAELINTHLDGKGAEAANAEMTSRVRFASGVYSNPGFDGDSLNPDSTAF